MSVGLQKIDPRNVGWITFKDQRAHWVGWLFFAGDEWRWPLGANPRYGWDETNSIVNSDSWPIFAVLFKATRIDVLASGSILGLLSQPAQLHFLSGRQNFSEYCVFLLRSPS